MASPEAKLATYRDLLALPPDVHAEVLSGEIVTAPAPLPRHSKVQGAARRFVGGPRLPRPGAVRPIEVVPDWVAEILSPATAARDRVQKRNLYARAGIANYWLIDPETRVLEALVLRDGVWLEAGVYDDSSTARIPPFEAIEIEVGRLFLPRDADEPPT